MARFPSFIGESASQQSLIAESQRTVNLYLERAPGQNGVSALYPTPGFQVWGTASQDVTSRAALFVQGRLFAVIGGGFYEFSSNGVVTLRGLVQKDVNAAQIIYNGVLGGQLGIASAGNFYVYDLAANTLTLTLAGDATMIAYAGGTGLAFNGATGKVRISGLNDLRVWNAGLFFQRSLFADPWQTMFVDANNLIWLIGTDTYEVWRNTGLGTQPWAPLTGLVGRHGIAAPWAFAATAMGNYWLSQNPEGLGQLVQTKGSSPQVVSNYAVSNAVAGYLRTTRIDDAEILPYQQDGHTFIVPSFPTAGATWCYDTDLSSWTERGQWFPATGYGLWAPRVHVRAWGKHLVGDRLTGNLWQMDTSFAKDVDGNGIRRLRRTPHLNAEHQRSPIDRLDVLMDVGLGIQSGQGSDPKAMLRVSADGGRTYGNERQASVGKIGEYRKLVTWNRLGASADAVFEVTYSEPTPFRLVDAFVNGIEKAA